MLTTEDNFLPYGGFGALLKVTFTDLDLDAVIPIGFRLDNRIYVNPPT